MISILLLYMRIFPTTNFKIAVFVNIGYTIAWAVSTWIINLTVCTPLAYYFDKTVPGTCRKQAISGTVSGGLSLLGDICILVLPLPMVLRLKINVRKKIAVCCIFLLGIL